MKHMHPVVHFEMSAEDTKRMADFYTGVFGWTAKDMGADMGHYMMVQTSETDDKGMVQKPGMINGGFFARTGDAASAVPSLVIDVPDVRAHMKKVTEAGGKLLDGQRPGEPDDIPGVGLVASFIDTEGNRVSMIQPVSMS